MRRRTAFPLFRAFALTCTVALAGAPASAHDTWVMPEIFRAAPGQRLPATLSAGHGLVPLVAPRRRRVASVHLRQGSSRIEPDGWRHHADRWTLSFTPRQAGVACLALGTAPLAIALDDALVDRYLAEIRPPPAVLAAWQAQRARGLSWHECYAKDAKAYLRVGRGAAAAGGGAAAWRRLARLGQRLELVPLADPTRVTRRSGLVLELLGDGRPLPGASLRLFAAAGRERALCTDRHGRVALDFEHDGPHLAAATVLELPALAGGPWRSRFATLGLHVGPA